MYRLTPFTYLIEGMTINLIHALPIVCKTTELNTFSSPPGTTCDDYLAPFFAAGGDGYLQTGSGTENCGYCRYTDGDQYAVGLGMEYSHRWRDFGLMWAYILFNMFLTALLFYLFRIWKFKFGKGTSKASGKTKQAADAIDDKTKAGGAGATEMAAVAPRTAGNLDARNGGQAGTSGP